MSLFHADTKEIRMYKQLTATEEMSEKIILYVALFLSSISSNFFELP